MSARAAFEPQDPEFEPRVRASFARQRFMSTLGATLTRVAPGEVDIELAVRDELTQQHGFLHAGALAAAADSACGYAALSLMPAGAAVLSVEFKINLLAPAAGERVVAHGRVIRAGRTVTVCWGEVVAHTGNDERLVATMVGTMMTVRDRGLAD
ncbi:MAG: PaaI family thioesterase [Gemmatimonadaceae bacterium]